MDTLTALDRLVVTSASPLAGDGSYATVPGTTVASRSRALVTQHKKETVKASVKEVDVLRRGLRRLETRMHELESRVQYVNPWVVQYMWELLCELRDKIGVQYSHQQEQAWLAGMRRPSGGQPSTEPRGRKAGAPAAGGAAAVKDAAVVATPLRLFDDSTDLALDDEDYGGNLDTSVSSESDNEEESLLQESVMGAKSVGVQNRSNIVQLSPRLSPRNDWNKNNNNNNNGSDGLRTGKYSTENRRRLSHYLTRMEAWWQFSQTVQEESNRRMEIALEESTQRSLFISRLACDLASASCSQKGFLLGSSMLSNSGGQEDKNVYRITTPRQQSGNEMQRRRGQHDELDFTSPPQTEFPGGLSPIEMAQTSSAFLSPPRGDGGRSGNPEGSRRQVRTTANNNDFVDDDSDSLLRDNRRLNGKRTREIASSMLSNQDFMRQIADTVSRQLAVQIQHADMMDEKNVSPSQSLPSALFLTVREAVNDIARTHDNMIYRQLQDCLAEEQRQRMTQEERFWQRVADQEDLWTQRVNTERKAEMEKLKEHERLAALGKENAESCSEVRRELLKLCGEVVRAVENIPDFSSSSAAAMPPASSEATTARQTDGGDSARHDKMELRLETLSAAVSSLYSDVERMRNKMREESSFPQMEWRGQTENRIASLQESFLDMQEAVAIVARKSRAAEDRLDASKLEEKEFTTWREKVQNLEDELEILSTLLSTTQQQQQQQPPLPPLPPPVAITAAATTTTTREAEGEYMEKNLLCVEDAMMYIQRIIFTHNSRVTSLTDPYIRALSALCSILQQVSHLYSIGTGTFGGSLRLIFSMPPFSLPCSLTTACQAYLREHSAAELNEALDAVDITPHLAKVLRDCYYWIQSHVLVVSRNIDDSGGGSGSSSTVKEEHSKNLGNNNNNNNNVSGETQKPEEKPLPQSTSMNSFHNVQTTPPNPVVCDAGSVSETLPYSEEIPFVPQALPNRTNCTTGTQTDLPKTANPSEPLSAPERTPRSTGKPTEECQSPKLESQTADPTTPTATATTALEALALASSPMGIEPHCGVVHHYHHHHDCGKAKEHAPATLCFKEEKERGGERTAHPRPPVVHFSELPSDNDENQWNSREKSRWDAAARRLDETSFQDMDDSSEQGVELSVPPLNRSHIDYEKRNEFMGRRMTQIGYIPPDLPPQPSMTNECLPLPTKISSFIDPQQVTRTPGRAPLSLKDPQPFYTSKTRHREYSQCDVNKINSYNNNNGLGHEKDAPRFATRSGGNDQEKLMHHFSRPYPSAYPHGTKSRGDILADVLAPELRQSSAVNGGDRSSKLKKAVRR